MNIDVMYSRKTDDWKTPRELYNVFINNGCIDPCPFKSNVNGLLYNFKNTKLFVNPPFSKMQIWVDWCITQFKNNCTVYLLIPNRSDTKYYHEILKYNPLIIFIKGRLKYNDCGNSAPFPTVLMVLSPNKQTNAYMSCTYETLINIIRGKQL